MNRFIRTTLRLTLAAAILTTAAAILPQAATAQKTVRYVKTSQDGGTATDNGLTWATASDDLQKMINDSSAGDEIWVFDGTYVPLYMAGGDRSTERDRAFVLKEGVKIYGGFTSNATTVPAFGTAGRDGESTLSGDLGNPGNDADNAYHVVISARITNDGKTVLDGFTISGGNANGIRQIYVNQEVFFRNYGGGIYNISSSPVLTHVTISGNSSDVLGGGIYNKNSSPHLTDVTISGNITAEPGGGGIYNEESSPVLTNVTISGNWANIDGGGIYNKTSSSPELTNTVV